MGKVFCKVLKLDEFTKLTGEHPKGSVIKLDYKIAMTLIKKEVVELSELEREIQGKKEETIKVDKDPALLAFLKRPDLMQCLVKQVQQTAVGEDGPIKTLLTIVALSKVKNKRATSANLCLNATSRAGKDYLLDATMQLVPDRYVFARRRVSQKALDYALAQHQSRDWNTYFVCLEDVSNKVVNSESVKTLMSANPDKVNTVSIVHEATVKNLQIKGKPTFIMTSASASGSDETLGRLPFCYLDETPKQTLEINLKQARDDTKANAPTISDLPKRFYDGLEQVTVIIPFAEDIAKALAEHWIKKSKRCQVLQRTIFPRFLDYIKASASLFQHQRKRSDKGHVLAEPQVDYNNARTALLQTTSNALMIPLNHEEKELIETLIQTFPDGGTVKEINMKISRWEERWLRNKLDRLVQLGFLEKDKRDYEGIDKPVAVYLTQPDILKFTIPKWEEIDSKNNTIGAVGAISTSGASSAKGQLHQLHGKFVVLKTQKQKSVTPLMEQQKKPIGPLPADWRPSSPDLPWLSDIKKRIKERGNTNA